ncbi:MAG: hypothetical protein K2X25_04180 [Caulobacteraceae bacterium]|nr:hypothetical protein [Caulobacteraceae bacterium]
MTDPIHPDAPLPKAPPPDLSTRAPRPTAVRLRKSVVQVVMIGAAALLSGSLAWAFVVQPELRANARERVEEGRLEEARGTVRPADVVTDQPSSYDRLTPGDQLPEPRTRSGESEPAVAATRATDRVRSPDYGYAAAAAPSAPRGRSVAQEAAGSGLFFGGGSGAQASGGPTPAGGASSAGPGRDYGAVYNGHALMNPLSPFELKAGAIVPAALLTGIDTSRSGPVVATVTQNVFDSVSGRHLLLPQGTRLIGRHDGESSYGDRRAFLTWERLILPNGKSLILTEEPGVDAQGAVGVQGRVDRRLFPLAVATLFAGAITTLGQIARDDDDGGGGLLGDVGDATAIEGARVGDSLIDRELQVRPSIRLRAGAPVRVLITRDLILEPYRP